MGGAGAAGQGHKATRPQLKVVLPTMLSFKIYPPTEPYREGLARPASLFGQDELQLFCYVYAISRLCEHESWTRSREIWWQRLLLERASCTTRIVYDDSISVC
jgi:hypothetical protein